MKNCCAHCLVSPLYSGFRQKHGWVLEKSLIRESGLFHLPKCSALESFKPRTVVVCGNGAVGWMHSRSKNPDGDNVWDLVQEAVSDFKKTLVGKGVGIPEDCFRCLQWGTTVESLVGYYEGEKPGSMDKEISTAPALLRKMMASKLAGSTIKLRFLECFNNCSCCERLPPNILDSCGVITLNWDAAVHAFPHTVHLHGKVNSPECLILPHQDFLKNQPKNGIVNQGFGSFHTARNWIENCQNFLFWGCQFNDYDSILLTVLTATTLTNQRRLNIFVCNPNRAVLEKKLRDYFPLANFIDCLGKFKSLI